MYKFLETTLLSFRKCFSREAAFKWFVLVIISFMMREDHLGVTSTIRALVLDPGCYTKILNFYRSSAYQTDDIRRQWHNIVRESSLLIRREGRCVLLGDGVKQSKEGFYMPGVQKHHQESEDSAKGEYIHGHMFGAVGVVIGNMKQKLCLPLQMSIQEGLSDAAGWEGSHISPCTHVIQMIENAFETAKVLGSSFLVLDRYFLTSPAIKKLNELNEAYGKRLVEIVTKAKRNCIAYEKPGPSEPGKRGRKRKKGAKVELRSFFEDRKAFTKATVNMYGENAKVEYFSIDLLWGEGLYQELRFVLVIYNGLRSILVSTDLTLSPETITPLYAERFQIERTFREFKQQIGGFCYHFWTKAQKKLNHYKEKGEPGPLANITDKLAQARILRTVDATERFVLFANIAMGLIQMMLLSVNDVKTIQNMRYLRTVSEGKISEATLMYVNF